VLKVVEKQELREAGDELLSLHEIAREGARRMLMTALKAEADAYVERHRAERDEQGHALVVRNGHTASRKVTLGAGTVEVQAPRVGDRRRDEQGRRQRFTSQILPPYMRRSPKVAEVLPILYLRGLLTAASGYGTGLNFNPSGASLTRPVSLAVDSVGNLFVINRIGANSGSVSELTVASGYGTGSHLCLRTASI
jgi:hypothetical protein